MRGDAGWHCERVATFGRALPVLNHAFDASVYIIADNIKDLARWLRRDDPDTRDVFFKLGEFDTARSDLVPIIVTHPDDADLVYNVREWLLDVRASTDAVPHAQM
jgi:hypothetical protein